MSGADPRAGGWADKVADLRARLAALESVAVAFSGGVDSGVLLHAARAALGERAVGVIADSPSLPRRELAEARALAARIGAELVVLATDEGTDPDYVANRGDRCYFCKGALFGVMGPFARARGLGALAFGEILDDRLDDRPGARAAAEQGVVAPLAEAGFTKADVRRYAREHGLPVADKPASACLASRIPTGTPVTPERLARVEAAEEALRGLGLRELRVRDRGRLARVEVGAAELDGALAREARVRALLAPLGFAAVELALYVPPAERARRAGA
jgi:uncharacterized protein